MGFHCAVLAAVTQRTTSEYCTKNVRVSIDSPPMRERQADRQTQRQTDRQRLREREKEREGTELGGGGAERE